MDRLNESTSRNDLPGPQRNKTPIGDDRARIPKIRQGASFQAYMDINARLARLDSVYFEDYHRPNCDPPATYRTSPVTVCASVRYITASAMSFTVETRPIGERLRITSFGVLV